MFLPGNEQISAKSDDERIGFWDKLNEYVRSFSRNEWVLVLGDLNAR